MNESELFRKITIGFMNMLSLDKRLELYNSGEATESICRRLKIEPDKWAVDQVMQWLLQKENKVIFYKDEGYPEYTPLNNRLPFMLFYRGTKPSRRNSIAIVGTRYPEQNALYEAFVLGLECCANGIAVVTGLAQGIDQSAARGGIGAANIQGSAPVVAVLGCGLDFDYPHQSSRLKNSIVEHGGTIISQFAPMMPPLRFNFPNRNVTLAAMGSTIVVVQAPRKSGSLITADFALQMGKDVMVASSGTGSNRHSAGSMQLYQDGALKIEHIKDVYSSIKFVAQEVAEPVVPYARCCDKYFNINTINVCHQDGSGQMP